MGSEAVPEKQSFRIGWLAKVSLFFYLCHMETFTPLYYRRARSHRSTSGAVQLNITGNYITAPQDFTKTNCRSQGETETVSKRKLEKSRKPSLRVPAAFSLDLNRAEIFALKQRIADLQTILLRGQLVNCPMLPTQRKLKLEQLEKAIEVLSFRQALETAFWKEVNHD